MNIIKKNNSTTKQPLHIVNNWHIIYQHSTIITDDLELIS